MTLEELTKQIFDECAKDGEPVTEDEAREMAEMELGAKGFKHEAKNMDAPKKERKPKTIKISNEKKSLFLTLVSFLDGLYGEDMQVVKENKEIALRIDTKNFKIDVVEHRPPKSS